MRSRDLIYLLTDTEYLAYRAGNELAKRHKWMGKARTYKSDGYTDSMQECVRGARDAHREYVRCALKLRETKEREADLRADYKRTAEAFDGGF